MAGPSPVSNGSSDARALLAKIKSQAIGLDAEYVLATGEKTRRIYLDTTASALRLGVVQEVLDQYQPFYSNTHSVLHFGAKLSTKEYAWVHDMVLRFVRADPEAYTAFFVGSGTTAGMNRVARTLREKRPERDVVITSIMEHHSNDLPHRKAFGGNVVHVPAEYAQTSIGRVNMDRLREAFAEHGERVNYVTITGVSNVTGIINPVYEIAELAHSYGALIVVDAAAMAAHQQIHTADNEDPAANLDVVVFSGHKVYAPGSPGVVVTRKDLFAEQEPQEVGGGMVEDVYLNRYTQVEKFPDREEAGTPNVSGAIGLGAALYTLDTVSMDVVCDEECKIINYALEQLKEIDNLIIYGEPDASLCARAGAIVFNIKDVEHGLTAAVLNDYFNISVRNECFCAHPYVREMITEVLAQEEDDMSDEELEAMADLHRGMVRASFGIYSTREDVDALAAALRQIAAEGSTKYAELYDRLPNTDYVHKTFQFDHEQAFSVRGAVDAWLAR